RSAWTCGWLSKPSIAVGGPCGGSAHDLAGGGAYPSWEACRVQLAGLRLLRLGGQIVLQDRDVERERHLAILLVAVQRAEEFFPSADLDRRTAALRHGDADPIAAQGCPQIGFHPCNVRWLHDTSRLEPSGGA